ncbi:MAG: CHAT domain-containing protein [Chitinophagales bacterium]|nr:CHAT domain-containing protein [Chitinophagales bacterium]
MNLKEIRIIVEPNRIYITRSIGSPEDGNMNRDYIKLELGIARIFHKVLNKHRLANAFEKNDFEILGKTLYKILFFEEKIRKFFLDELAETRENPGSHCRIYLQFKGLVGDISELPWEYLLVDDEDRHISDFYVAADNSLKFDFIRCVKENKGKFIPKAGQKLNVALIISNPRVEPEGRMKLEKDKLYKCFDRLKEKHGELLIINERDNDKPDFNVFAGDLKEVISQFEGEPYVLHFYGHAQVRDNEAMIAFTDDTENTAWIPDKELSEIFSEQSLLPKPELVILQACESGQVCSADSDDPGGIAYCLAMKDIPAVVSMQNIVREDVSIAFIEQFYNAVLQGEDVAAAVTRGRQFLGCGNKMTGEKRKVNEFYDNNTFGTPVLFISTLQPIRLMPEKATAGLDKQLVNKKCTKCPKLWPNVRPDKELCTFNRCGGRLELIREEGASDSKGQAGQIRESLPDSSFN